MTKRLRFELSAKSGHEFQGVFRTVLGELLDGSAETKRLGLLDQIGVDALILTSDHQEIQTAIQCKGFELPEYGPKQHRQCREEIAKFQTKGPSAPEYWLVINRPIKDRANRAELESDLAQLVQIGKVTKAELLDQEPLVRKLTRLATERLVKWAEAKRTELFNYYTNRMEFVQYIGTTPFNGTQSDPVNHILGSLRQFFDKLPEHQTGKTRRAPKILVTSEFGFGKTSTLQALARNWIDADKHVIYVPAALLEHEAFVNTSGIVDAIFAFLTPDDIELSDLASQVFRDTLRNILVRSKDWLVLIDGLDENAYAFKANGLIALWRSMADLGIPAVLSARDELVDFRQTEFFPDQDLKIAPVFERIRLNDWPVALIAQFIHLFAAARGGNEPPSFVMFRNLIESDSYDAVYGDIPKRPLFLGMLAEDAWSGNKPTRQLHRLYGKYFRKKFLLDRISMAASGAGNRPSAIVDALGLDEAVERLIQVMQDAADQMLEITGEPGTRSAVHRDTIGEKLMRDITDDHGIPFMQIEDVAMHSLLQPAGREPVTHERMMRFAHRSFQDWFLARQFAEKGREPYQGLPPATMRFLNAMREDLASGGSLP